MVPRCLSSDLVMLNGRSSLSASTKFVPLSELKRLGVPLLDVIRMKAYRNESASRLLEISRYGYFRKEGEQAHISLGAGLATAFLGHVWSATVDPDVLEGFEWRSDP